MDGLDARMYHRSTVRILLDAAALILQVADDHGRVVLLREPKVLSHPGHMNTDFYLTHRYYAIVCMYVLAYLFSVDGTLMKRALPLNSAATVLYKA